MAPHRAAELAVLVFVRIILGKRFPTPHANMSAVRHVACTAAGALSALPARRSRVRHDRPQVRAPMIGKLDWSRPAGTGRAGLGQYAFAQFHVDVGLASNRIARWATRHFHCESRADSASESFPPLRAMTWPCSCLTGLLSRRPHRPERLPARAARLRDADAGSEVEPVAVCFAIAAVACRAALV